jgi:hypothetical protein
MMSHIRNLVTVATMAARGKTQRRSILNEGARASFGVACSTTTEEAVVAVGRPRAHNASIEAQ